MENAIEVRGLTKRYDGRAVVDGLDLTVRRGTVFGLLGANGAGKSTSIECMLGTRRADGGTVRLLPALPACWPEGTVHGLRVRGDYEVDITWREHRLQLAVFRAGHAGTLRLADGRSISHMAGDVILASPDALTIRRTTA